MFHLFKKVYLDFDDKINMSYDRMICSEKYGGLQIPEHIDKFFYGIQMASAKNIQELFGTGTFLDIISKLNDKVDQRNCSVFIYCDKVSYYKLAILWMKIVLPHCDFVNAWKFFKSHIFKEKNFVNSRMSAHERFSKESETWLVESEMFRHYWEEMQITSEERARYKFLLQQVITNMRIEFLLAGYLYDGRYADQFAKAITPLVRKDLEKFLNEHKEIILVHFQRPKFQELLQVVNGPYTFDNFYDMVDDPAPMVQIMFKPEIWGETKSSMYTEKSSGAINLSAFTDEDITTLKQYSAVTGTVWSGEQWYTVLRSEVDKFDYIKMFRNKDHLSVEDLEKILDYEIHHLNHSAGSFYSIDLRTVNNYFVDFVLQNKDNKDKLKPYVFEIP